MDTLDEKQLDMKMFMEVLDMANVMQMVIESLNLLLQMILLTLKRRLIAYQEKSSGGPCERGMDCAICAGYVQQHQKQS